MIWSATQTSMFLLEESGSEIEWLSGRAVCLLRVQQDTIETTAIGLCHSAW